MGLKPTESRMVALTSCNAVDLDRVLARQREAVKGLKIGVSGDQERDAP